MKDYKVRPTEDLENKLCQRIKRKFCCCEYQITVVSNITWNKNNFKSFKTSFFVYFNLTIELVKTFTCYLYFYGIFI